MGQAHINLWFGVVGLSLAWHSFTWVGLWYGMAWNGLVYIQVSLLTLGGWGKSKLRLNPDWAELGNKTCIAHRNKTHLSVQIKNPKEFSFSVISI